VTALLQVRDLAVDVATRAGARRAVEGVSFHVGEGEVLALVGESGSGKTLTCRSILRLLPANVRIAAGSIDLAGVRVTDQDERGLQRLRGPVGAMIFQNPTSHLDPVMSVGEQIAAPIRVHERLPRREALRRAHDLLAQVGIPDPVRRARQYPHEFSGGMRQRVMIAAALACRPRLLIADEPTTALDVTVQAQILRLLLDLRDRLGLAIVLVTHDLGVVAQTCDRVAVMYAGRIVEAGPKSAVLTRPLQAYTADLIASQPGRGEPGAPLASIRGQAPGLGDRPAGCAFAPRCPVKLESCDLARPPVAEPAPGRSVRCVRAG
jgi:peptide/nickel transport system ATP-binding protein